MRYKKLGSLGLLTAAATALLLTGSGCSPLSQEELNRLVKEDAEFARMITARDQVNGQVHLIRQDLLNRKKILNAQVEKIRTEYDAYARVQNQKIEQYRSTIRANRQLLKQEIEKAQAELAAKTTECSGYQKTLADIRKVLQEGKGIRFSVTEKQKWQERVVMLTEKMRPLMEEVQELGLRIKLKYQKMNYLN